MHVPSRALGASITRYLVSHVKAIYAFSCALRTISNGRRYTLCLESNDAALFNLILNLHPHRRMVRRLLPPADLAVDFGFAQAGGQGGAEQQVVDAQAGIAFPAVIEVVPEGEDLRLGVQAADRVGPALGQELGIGLFRLRLEQGVLDPALRVQGIEVGGDDVVVAGQDDRGAGIDQVLGMGLEALEPGELVVEFGPRARIAVGQVEAADQHAVHCRLDIAAVTVVGVAR